MVEELIKLKSDFRRFGDEEEEEKAEELPLDESLGEDKDLGGDPSEDEEEF